MPRKPCPISGCNYPEGQCCGACMPTRSDRASRLEAELARYGIPLPPSIDLAYPDPHPGDPWPRHLCMPGLEWPAPPDAVLRPDRPVSCPPCTRRCRQGRDCPAAPVRASNSARVAFAVNLVLASAVSALVGAAAGAVYALAHLRP